MRMRMEGSAPEPGTPWGDYEINTMQSEQRERRFVAVEVIE